MLWLMTSQVRIPAQNQTLDARLETPSSLPHYPSSRPSVPEQILIHPAVEGDFVAWLPLGRRSAPARRRPSPAVSKLSSGVKLTLTNEK